MPRKKKTQLKIEVEPKILKWAIDSSGWTASDVAKKIKVDEATFDEWIAKKSQPTLPQLENLAMVLKRPLAAFFLSEPPAEMPLPKDYRMLPSKEGIFDNKTMLAIRKARRLQKIARELSENVQGSVVPLTRKASISDDAGKAADTVRAELKYDDAARRRCKDAYGVFNYLRDAIEERNVLVFLLPLPLDDARGFALADDAPAVLVVNSKDAPEARVFTLMHEFGHLLLNESGISMPENALFIPKVDRVEKWCNDFASAFLLPREAVYSSFYGIRATLTETPTLNKLSRSHRVSKAMLLYNMRKWNLIGQQQYDSVLKRYRPSVEPVKAAKKGGKFKSQPADKKCVAEKGQRFVSLVTNNVERGLITHNEALDFLSIKSKNLEKVASRVKK